MKNQQKNGVLKPLLLAASTCIAALGVGAAVAETTLRSPDGTVNLTGKLIAYDDENFTIQTEFGELIVRRVFVECEGDGCPGAAASEADAAKDEGVLLVSPDGSVRLEGPLVEVTDTDYVINTQSGVLTVRKEFVACEGAACPTAAVKAAEFRIAVPGRVAKDLVAAIVGGFAASKDFSLTENLGSGSNLASLLVGDEKGQPVARIGVEQMSEGQAIAAVLKGDVAFALTREEITPQRLSNITARKVARVSELLDERIIGLDAVTFALNASNQIDVLRMDQVRAVLAGEIGNWQALGGRNAPIRLHMLANDKALQDLVQARLAPAGMVMSREITLHESASALNAALRSDPTALGVIYRSQTEGVKPLRLADSCDVFFDSSDFAVQTEEYPLAMRWHQYSAKARPLTGLARNIGEFIATDAGQSVIASQGLVPQDLRIVPMQEQGARLLSTTLASGEDRATQVVLREYLTNASNAKRISTSLHFLSGASTLDVKALEDLERISDIVRSGDYEGYQLLVFGFSDSHGRLSGNLALSKRRAQAVEEILLRENAGYLERANIASFGVGPIAPVSCNDTREGRQLNRRVEVWIRPGVS